MNGFTITGDEYLELVRAAERIATVERLCKKKEYVSTGVIKAILNIDETKEKM